MQVSTDDIRLVKAEFGQDARLIVVKDFATGEAELMVETPCDTTTPPTPQLMDVRVQIINLVFTFSGIVSMIGAILGSIPFFLSLPTQVAFHGLLSSVGLVVGFYIVFVIVLYTQRFPALALFVPLVISGVCVIGFSCSLLNNLAPLQLCVILFAQAASVVVYCNVSPRGISVPVCAGIMAVATIAAWCMGIYGYVVESDWISSGVVAAFSICLLAYNVVFIIHTEGNYDTSTAQKTLACMTYYCWPFLLGIKAVHR